jgi:serine/threonine-protein kinase RsbT
MTAIVEAPVEAALPTPAAPYGPPPVIAVTIDGEADLLRVRSTLRAEAQAVGLGLTATTKLVTAGSELARNILRYAVRGHGVVTVQRVSAGLRVGVRAQFTDYGPGIDDLDQVMVDGFSSGGSLGIGLPGSRRLVDEFLIESAAGRGTTVVIAQWDR